MNAVDEMKRLLAEQYGICSGRDLNRALASVGRINIGVFTAPVQEGGITNETVDRIA